MADLARRSATPSGTENIGDVLASIRRLIAQDEANGLSDTTARRLGNPAQHSEKAVDPDDQTIESTSGVTDAPLVLGSGELIGPVQPAPQATAAPGPDALAQVASQQAEPQAADPEPGMEPLLSIPSFAHAQAQEQAQTAANGTTTFTTNTSKQVDTMIQQAHATAPTQLHPSLADSALNANPTAADSVEAPRNLFLMEEEDFVMPDTPLRGMIRETLVQELQGEFGDQFSRKLRNLVRAEIALALKEAIKG